jgi:hypothetical protein
MNIYINEIPPYWNALDIVEYNIIEYLCLGKLMVGKLETKFYIQLHNFAHNLHLKATKNTVFQWN